MQKLDGINVAFSCRKGENNGKEVQDDSYIFNTPLDAMLGVGWGVLLMQRLHSHTTQDGSLLFPKNLKYGL
jgi:hypothetical protein